MNRHWDALAVAGVVVAAAALMVALILSNSSEIDEVRTSLGSDIDGVRTSLGNDIKNVRGEVQTLAGESRASSAEILRILFEIKKNTAVTHVKAEHNEKDIEKMSSHMERLGSRVHDLDHKVDANSVDSAEESP